MSSITSITERLANRLIDIKARYRRLEGMYERIDITSGVDLEAKHPVERFCAKAILGWQPTKNNFNAKVSGVAAKTEFGVDQDEQKPIATMWFRDITLVSQRLKAKNISADTVRLMDQLMHQIVYKYNQAEIVLKMVYHNSRSSKNVAPTLKLALWNEVCQAIKDDMPIAQAVEDETVRFKHQSQTQSATPTGTGRCFEFAVEFEVPVWKCTPKKPYDPSSLSIASEVKPVEKDLINCFKVGPVPAYTTAFEQYVEKWKKMKPYEAGWPYPVGGMTAEALHDFSRFKLSPSVLARLSTAQKMALKAKAFLLAGNGITATFAVGKGDDVQLMLGVGTKEAEIKALQKYLKHKELARWHSDRINKRTGVEGSGPDESIGSSEEVKMVRTAVDELVEMCEDWKRFLPKQGLSDSFWASQAMQKAWTIRKLRVPLDSAAE